MILTHVDLFAGVGGFSLALQRAGAKTVANVEIDKNCRTVLAKYFPDVVQFEDIKNVSGNDLRSAGFIPERGIFTGGFPCQDISIAGKGVGLAGDRSGLFWEIVRLLEELHPQWFILENVPRLLSINGGRDMGTVIQALVDCGYGVAWRVLDAQYFGVPQRRRRIFIVGHLGGSGRAPAEILFEPEGMFGDLAASGEAQPEVAGDVAESARDGGAIYAPRTAATLTAGVARKPGVNPPGRRQEDDENIVVSTLQGGGKRGYRIDAEAEAGGHLLIQSQL